MLDLKGGRGARRRVLDGSCRLKEVVYYPSFERGKGAGQMLCSTCAYLLRTNPQRIIACLSANLATVDNNINGVISDQCCGRTNVYGARSLPKSCKVPKVALIASSAPHGMVPSGQSLPEMYEVVLCKDSLVSPHTARLCAKPDERIDVPDKVQDVARRSLRRVYIPRSVPVWQDRLVGDSLLLKLDLFKDCFDNVELGLKALDLRSGIAKGRR